MPRIPDGPQLVNRGPAGLRDKVPTTASSVKAAEKRGHLWEEAPKDRCSPSLEPLMIDIDSVTLDPNNARMHPERNMDAIKDSICLYGQKKAIVVREQTMTVVAGNGTWQACKELGWTRIAANVEPMTDQEAIGYGLADNRTAELARWNWETTKRLGKLLEEMESRNGREGGGSGGSNGSHLIGWTDDEIEAISKEWKPPTEVPSEDGSGNGNGNGKAEAGNVGKGRSGSFSSLELTESQRHRLNIAVAKYRLAAEAINVAEAECVLLMCEAMADVLASESEGVAALKETR